MCVCRVSWVGPGVFLISDPCYTAFFVVRTHKVIEKTVGGWSLKSGGCCMGK